jgi:O-antigen/teichoic acid export membrane protein
MRTSAKLVGEPDPPAGMTQTAKRRRSPTRKSPSSQLARNTAWIGFGQLIRLGIQAIYFVLIARALGASEYGSYVSVAALATIAAPFASMGSGYLLIQNVARVPETFSVQWGRALAITAVFGGTLLGIVTLVAGLLLPRSIPLTLVLAVSAADLLFARFLDISGQAYLAVHRLDRTAQIELLLSPLRLVAALVLIATQSAPTAVEWGVLYLVSSVVGSTVAIALVTRELGRPRFQLRETGTEWREGVAFSVGLSALSWNNNIDKTMLSRLGTLEATGTYAAAFRVVDIAFLPIGSLLAATYARFFQEGMKGMRATGRFALQLLKLGAGYAVLAAAALYAVAPVLPAVLGSEYQGAVPAVRWLALLPLLRAIHYFGADALTGAGYQAVRTVILVVVAVLNLGLNLLLVPSYSWRGAAAAVLICNGVLAISIWTAVWYLRRKGRSFPAFGTPSSVVEVG